MFAIERVWMVFSNFHFMTNLWTYYVGGIETQNKIVGGSANWYITNADIYAIE